jgi:hypothetical protein
MKMEKVSVPVGRSGDWSVERFEISPTASMYSVFRYGRRAPEPGVYTRLCHWGEIVMSDTTAEQEDHRQAIMNAHGHVLINGLGLGFVLQNCLNNPKVEKATVIEISSDVIALVAPHYLKRYGNRVEIIQGDAFTWQPPKRKRYGMVWHDIWPNICGDNYPEMKTLHRRYGRKADWQGSWCKGLTKRHHQGEEIR